MKSIASIILLIASISLMAQQIKETPIADVAIATLHLDGFPDFMASDGDGMWVTNEGRIEKLKYDQPKPTQSITIPDVCGIFAYGFGSLWVASCEEQAVYRIDPSTGKQIAKIITGLADPTGEFSLAAGAGSVWLLTKSSGELSRIDPSKNKVVSHIKVAPNSFVVDYGFNSIWITNTVDAAVQRIDPTTEKVMATIPVGKEPRFMTIGLGAVWALNQEEGTVSKIDPSTNQATTLAVNAKGTGGDITAGDKYLYVRAKSTLLIIVDPTTNEVISRLGPAAGSGAVRIEHGRIWVTAHDINTIWVLEE
jgi:virginiamycin B lyase